MPLSEFATPLAKSLVGSTAKLASVLQHKVETKRWTNQSRSIAERITATFSPGLASSLKPTDIAATSEFLASQAFTELCFQTLTIRMVTNSDAVERLTKDYIERHLRPIVHAESAKQLSIALSGALTQASDLLLGDATFIQVFRSETIRREAHERLATLLLDSIDARLAAISAAFTTSSPEDIDAFEKRYRLQVQSRYRKITPPTFGTQKSVPFGKVYVPAVLDCGGESVVLGDFLATFHRAVVAGDPGGGKTTLSTKVLLDASGSAGLFGRKQIVPFIVTLREYAARKVVHPLSIVEFIEEGLRASFQISEVPDSAVELLLATGRGLVVFDGLDELLDTTGRRHVVQDVEQFCSLYPTVPVLVTSRLVGYREAPLDEDLFRVFTLAPFTKVQVQDYVSKWFSITPDLRADERTTFAADFIKDSVVAGDLLANPLMLSLMCNLYRGERYIPKNRPELYEKCATWLFERWDRDRGVVVPLPFKEHVRPAMTWLAAKIYESARLQTGVPKAELVDLTTDFLLQAKYDDLDRAERGANEFVDFCTGRAWVFTNTGSDTEDELFQFTHRTFLEYFTAAHLVRVSRTPEALLTTLRPHIEQAEWDVVAQLSVQMMTRQTEGGSSEVLDIIRGWTNTASINSAANCLLFGCRLLEFLEPRESAVRDFIAASGQFALGDHWAEFARLRLDGSRAGDARALRKISPRQIFSSWLVAALENQTAVVEALNALLADDSCIRNPVLRHMAIRDFDFESAISDPVFTDILRQSLRSSARRLDLFNSDDIAEDLFALRETQVARPSLVSARSRPRLLKDLFRASLNLIDSTFEAPDAYVLLRDSTGASEYGLRVSAVASQQIRSSEPPWFEYPELMGEHLHLVEMNLSGRGRRRVLDQGTGASREFLFTTAVLSVAAIEAAALVSNLEPGSGQLGAQGLLGTTTAPWHERNRDSFWSIHDQFLAELDPGLILKPIYAVSTPVGRLADQALSLYTPILQARLRRPLQ